MQDPDMQVCICSVLTLGGKQNEAVWGEGKRSMAGLLWNACRIHNVLRSDQAVFKHQSLSHTIACQHSCLKLSGQTASSTQLCSSAA